MEFSVKKVVIFRLILLALPNTKWYLTDTLRIHPPKNVLASNPSPVSLRHKKTLKKRTYFIAFIDLIGKE